MKLTIFTLILTASFPVFSMTCGDLFKKSNIIQFPAKFRKNEVPVQPSLLPESPLKEKYLGKSLDRSRDEDGRDVTALFDALGIRYLLLTIDSRDLNDVVAGKKQLNSGMSMVQSKMEGKSIANHMASGFEIVGTGIHIPSENYKIGFIFPIEILNNFGFQIRDLAYATRKESASDKQNLVNFDSSVNTIEQLGYVLSRLFQEYKGPVDFRKALPNRNLAITLSEVLTIDQAIGIWIPQPLSGRGIVSRESISKIQQLFSAHYFDFSIGKSSRKFIYDGSSTFPNFDNLKK